MPSADLVVPGVWWLRGTRGCNVYAREAADGSLVLIDTGFSGNTAAILAAVASVAPGRQVTQILLTHAHVDHSGSAAELRARLGAKVVAGRAECLQDARGAAILRPSFSRPWQRWRRGDEQRASEVQVDRPLEGEHELAGGLIAVPTPGHTAGSYCYVDVARRVAFVGDLVISHHDGLSRPLPFTNADDRVYLDSLARFAATAPEIGCAGHGAPVREDFGAQLRGLATLPRRSMLSPSLLASRARKLVAFGRGLAARRH